jgi:hypothetical protein
VTMEDVVSHQDIISTSAFFSGSLNRTTQSELHPS